MSADEYTDIRTTETRGRFRVRLKKKGEFSDLS